MERTGGEPSDDADDDGGPTGDGDGDDGLSGIDRLFDRADHWQRRRPAVAFVVGVLKRGGDDEVGHFTALLSYYGFLSLLPLLLFVSTVLARVLAGDPARREEFLQSTVAGIPVVGQTLTENISVLPRSGLVLVLSLLGALWGGLSVVHAAQEAFNTMWNVPRRDRPNLVLRSVRGMASLGALAVAFAFTAGGSSWLIAQGLPVLLQVLGHVILLGVNTLAVLAAFELLTARRLGWRRLIVGAVAAGFGLLVLQLVGGLYLTRVVARADAFYGVFAAALGLLIWLSLQARVLLYASEINVVRHDRLWPRSITGRSLTDADHRSATDVATRQALVDGERVAVAFHATDGRGPTAPPDRVGDP